MPKKKKKENIKTTISYQGTVKIQSVKGGKVYKEKTVHNSGTADLFRYIANCVIGNYNQSLMPRYVHVFTCENPESKLLNENDLPDLWTNSVCALNVPYSTVQVRQDTSSGSTIEKPYISEFTFMIPYSQIQDSFNVVCLYNVTSFGRTTTPLAYIILDEPYEVENNNTSNIVITWEMKICNQEISI